MATSTKDKESCVPCPAPKLIPLINVAYPNENKSHVKVFPTGGTPGIDPCCAPQPCPGYNEDPSLCPPIACNAPAADPCVPGACYDKQTLHQRTCECEQCICQRLHAMDTQPCFQHTEGNCWRDLSKKSHDPEITALMEKMRSSQGIRNILTWCPTDESLTCVERKFRQYPVGITGQASVHYGSAQDLDYPRNYIHGVLSDEVTPGTRLINPPPKRWVEQLDLNIKESIYESNRFRPIGKSHDQTRNLPPHIHPECTGFGKPSDKSISAGLLVNPPKTKDEVAAEARCCRALYKMTHGNYEAGEQVCRNYDAPYRRTNTFGIQTPCDPAGRYVKKVTSSWRSCQPDPPYVSKVVADHTDFRLPKLGTGMTPNCIRQTHGYGRTYGKPSEIERERPIREIIFNRCYNEGAEKAAKMMRNLKNWLDRVRRSFRSAEGPDFEKWYEDIVAADPDCNGQVDWDPFVSAIEKHHVPRTLGETDFMEALAYVNVFSPAPVDKVNYYLLMDIIKGYEDPMFHCKTTTLKPWYCPHTNEGGNHFVNEGDCTNFLKTIYSEMTSNMCNPQDCFTQMKEAYVNGMPSVRSDKTPNKIRSTKDFTNYGDDGDAYSLIWPSHYTLNGITCRDAFREISKEELAKVLCLAQVEMSHQELDQVYQAAQELDPEKKCRVSYQTFREALCMVREENARIFNCHIGYQTEPCCDSNVGPCPPIVKRKKNPCMGVDP